MLFLLLRKFEGDESLNGGSALFSGGEIGSKIFRIYNRKRDISIMITQIIGQWLDQRMEIELATFSAIISAGVLQSC